MLKSEFSAALRARLSDMPKTDIDRSLDYYSEMIDDHIEEGLTEEEAVASVGTPEEIAARMRGDVPPTTDMHTQTKMCRRLRPWEIVLLIFGAPLWLPLLITGVAVAFTLYIVLWSVMISLYAVVFSAGTCAIVGLIFAIVFAIQGRIGASLFFLGSGCILGGLCIGLFFGCHYSARAICRGTKLLYQKIKNRYANKERIL